MARTAAQKVEDKKVDSQAEVKSGTENVNESKKDEIDVSALLNIIKNLQNEIETLKTKNDLANEMSKILNKSDNDEFVTIVNTSMGIIHGKFQTWSFRMTNYGQKQTISKANFYELFNNRSAWFKKNYLALDVKNIDYAKEIGCPVYDESNRDTIKPSDIEKWGDMSEYEMDRYYNNLSDSMKIAFASYFMRRCYDKDPKFYDINKMNRMNQLTGGNMFDNLIIACQNSFLRNKK